MEKQQMIGHRKRLRKRYLTVGYKGMEDYEILELLLTYSIKMKDCKSLSKTLLLKFKTIDAVIKSEIIDLKEVEGIGEETALYLKLVGDIISNCYFKEAIKSDITTIKGRDSLIAYLQDDMGALKAEEFKVIYLNNDNKIVCDEVLFKGTIDRSVVYPRKIVERAINNRAKAVIFVHNHPSGNLTPSKKDIEITLEMQEILEKMDIRLVEHIIISEDSYYSFSENGLV